jgi:MFS family permease
MSQPNQYQLLKQRRFAPFFWVQFLGAMNDNVFKNALMILIAFQTARLSTVDSGTLINLAAGLFILPFFLFSATFGQFADKYQLRERRAGRKRGSGDDHAGAVLDRHRRRIAALRAAVGAQSRNWAGAVRLDWFDIVRSRSLLRGPGLAARGVPDSSADFGIGTAVSCGF